MGGLTVVNVVEAGNDADLDRLVGEWAKSAWAAWSSYHPVVRKFYPERW